MRKIKLTRFGDYAVRAMLDLAGHPEERRKTRQIAAAMDIPFPYLQQVLAHLVSEGLVASTAGPAGGYRLERPAAEITFLEVVEAADGPIVIDECVLDGGPCDWEPVCAVHTTWAEAQDAFVSRLRMTTLADLAEIDAAIMAGIYEPPPDWPPHAEVPRRRGIRRSGADTG